MKRDPAHTFSSELFDLPYYSCADLVMPIDRHARSGRFGNVRKARGLFEAASSLLLRFAFFPARDADVRRCESNSAQRAGIYDRSRRGCRTFIAREQTNITVLEALQFGGYRMLKTTTVTAIALLACSPTLMAQQASAPVTVGVTAAEIKVGATFPFSGPASALGNVGKALIGYVALINDKGGINGRKINLIAFDDAYTPSKSVEQNRKLVESDEVAFLYSPIGTASISAILKYANDRKVPQLSVVSGANKFARYADYPYTTTGLPSYDTEGKIYAKFITQKLPGARIAILYQNDDMGKDLVGGFRSFMKADFDKLVTAKPYETTDPTIDSQIVSLKTSGAEAFFIAGTPKFTAQALRRAREIGWNPLTVVNFPSSSVAGTFVPAGLDNAKGVVSGTFQKDPVDPRWKDDPAVNEYREFVTKYIPNGDVAEAFYVLGAIQGQILEQILKQCGNDFSRENIIKQAISLRDFSPAMGIPGITINTSATNHQAWTSLQLQQFNGVSWERLGGLISATD
jgi:branched-chain amino acid transport system substrate-binding protein